MKTEKHIRKNPCKKHQVCTRVQLTVGRCCVSTLNMTLTLTLTDLDLDLDPLYWTTTNGTSLPLIMQSALQSGSTRCPEECLWVVRALPALLIHQRNLVAMPPAMLTLLCPGCCLHSIESKIQSAFHLKFQICHIPSCAVP
jgi:hypothetical protein